MRTLAIGDIHGCFTALQTVLTSAQVTPEDFLVFLGDYIDRGPDSKKVIEWLIERAKQQRIVTLRGNHEVMILAARQEKTSFDLWHSYGGGDALRSYGATASDGWQHSIPVEHWQFIEQTRPWFETETHIFVHATLNPVLDLAEQPDWLLYWEFFDRKLRHKSGKRIVCGHTRQRSGWPNVGKSVVCIDTGACAGKWLTCLDVDSGKFWQANQKCEARDGQLSEHGA